MKSFAPFLILIVPAMLSACSVAPHYKDYTQYLEVKSLPLPTKEKFIHCHGYGCHHQKYVSIHPNDWRKIKNHFRRSAKSPSQERKKIAAAIKDFEIIVGTMTGTSADIKDTFLKTGPFQLDCNDESINTSTYIFLMQSQGWLQFHTLAAPSIRPPGGGSLWLHESAVIIETKTNTHYAVDSWWQDNGHKPYIIPYDEWQNGWRPSETKDDKNL